jgi:hypothetical protein
VLWTLQEPQCFTVAASLSPGKLISGSRTPYKEKKTLPRTFADISEFVCVTAFDPERPISVSEFGNINPIPFRIIFTFSLTRGKIATFETAFADSLGPTDPCSTAVHMEPFSTLVLKGLT